ncbi:MAG TPA: protein kinase [Steroidobacteraceae bacterium]|nr:protein kinase [Steroidobacteraceae bacterium]
MEKPRASASFLQSLSPAEFAQVSRLLDEALDLSMEDRPAWLADLERRDPHAAGILRTLLDLQGNSTDQPLLDGNLVAELVGPLVDSDSILIGKQFGPYRVLSLLGHGGMGSVWLAERVDGLFTRQVALKLIHPALMGKVMTERATREREILASLNHPHIARLIDAGFSEDSQPYLALEYVAGKTITEYCDEQRLPLRSRLELFRQVLSAVQYAHANLVIHRDLKPSNVLVTQDGQVYLLDFGIAKLLTEGKASETELTRVGGRALTPDYAAPEQIAGLPITTAADVYALGVIFYELLTGERPYKLKRESVGALEEAILRTDPAVPSRSVISESAAGARSATPKRLAKSLAGDLDTIVLKALKKKPTERYATANAFDEDVARYLGGEVVLAQPDSLAYRVAKFVGRHRVGIAAAAVLILILAGGLAATTYEARVAAIQRDAAIRAQLRSVTQTAAERLKNADIPGALAIILEVLPKRGAGGSYTPEALGVFQDARAADPQLVMLAGHTDKVRSAAFSPDGRRVVTASYDLSARVWDAESGVQVLQLKGHTKAVRSAAFSPDGLRIVTSALDKTARIWDAATGREIMVLNGHEDRLRNAAFSPDGRRIATASYDKTARIWDAAAGRELLTLAGHTGVVYTAVFSADGRRVLTASYDKTARIWDAGTGREILRINSPAGGFSCAAFSPDGSRIVTASEDTTARVWDTATGREVMLLGGNEQGVLSAAFSPDGDRIVTAGNDESVRIWEVKTGREILLIKAHALAVTGVAFSPDGLRVVSSSDDTTARIWSTVANGEIRRLIGHAQGLPGADFSPDGRRVATASSDRTARIWDTASGAQLQVLNGHTELILSAEFSPDGRYVATASDDRTARIWNAATGEQLKVLSGHALQVEGAAFSPDGRRIVTASYDKTGRIWDAQSGRELVKLQGHAGPLDWAVFSPDGRSVLTASDDKTVRIWDVATGRVSRVLSGHEAHVTSAAYSSDGERIVSSSNDKTARIWEAATGQQVKTLRHADSVNTAAFSPDGRLVVTATFNPSALIWDASAPPIDTQVAWAAAAQFDLLPSVERGELGLEPPADVRRWAKKTQCDEFAGSPFDPDRHAAGLQLDDIVADIALAACANGQRDRSGDGGRSLYQHGRALLAGGQFVFARQDFEQALESGYRGARIDLASLLAQASSGFADLPRAAKLYEQAWEQGVRFAGFALGGLYEYGVPADTQRAWDWYQRAADAGEPNALARFGAREESAALSADSADKQRAHWIAAFKYYSAAAERARREDWPDGVWRNWRYRRATLARLLAREGLMQQVADTYTAVHDTP